MKKSFLFLTTLIFILLLSSTTLARGGFGPAGGPAGFNNQNSNPNFGNRQGRSGNNFQPPMQQQPPPQRTPPVKNQPPINNEPNLIPDPTFPNFSIFSQTRTIYVPQIQTQIQRNQPSTQNVFYTFSGTILLNDKEWSIVVSSNQNTTQTLKVGDSWSGRIIQKIDSYTVTFDDGRTVTVGSQL